MGWQRPPAPRHASPLRTGSSGWSVGDARFPQAGPSRCPRFSRHRRCVRVADQLGPVLVPVVRAEIPAADGSVRHALDLRAALRSRGLDVVPPVADGDVRHPERASKFSRRPGALEVVGEFHAHI